MPLDENREAPRGLLTAFKLVKSRNVAKSKIRHISENETEINGVVDFRLSRQKSPRNSEFIERLADHSNQVHEKTFLSYKESVRKKILKTLNAEKSSRTTKIATHAEPAFLHKVRKQAMTRRSATFVKNKKLASEKFIPPVEQKRFNGYNIENRELQYKQRVLKGVVNRPLQANRSILHSRNPSKRNFFFVETPALVVPARAFQIRKQLRSRSRKLGLNKKIANRQAIKKKLFLP